MQEDFDYIIGSDISADVVLSNPEISKKHALFRRRGDRLFIKPLCRDSQTFLNGRPVKPYRFQEFTRFDKLRLATLPIELSSGLFMGRKRLGLRTTPLVLTGKGGRVLCNQTIVEAKPGTVTAIMGPSGSGKTVLLKVLAGITNPQEGEVFLWRGDREYFHLNGSKGMPIGYVPQGDSMFPELTPGTSLDFRLKLLFADMKPDVRKRLIQQTIQRVGFSRKRLNQFMNTCIGSADSGGAVLSGGERRRANLCHELISQPLILLLDEPTSGLSSRDADEVMALLRHLAKEEGLTIITTLHQPSEEGFNKIDQLVLLSYGGVVAYQGSASEAVNRIAEKTGLNPSGRSASEFIVEAHGVLARNPLLENSESAQPDLTVSQTKNRKGFFPGLGKGLFSLVSWINQFIQLFQRQAIIMMKDHGSMLYAFIQVPILFFLVFITFHGSGKDYEDYDQLTRTQHQFQELRAREGGNPQNALNRAYLIAQRDNSIISAVHARHKASFLYILTLIAIWFGLMSSACDIVTRKEIIARESRSGISLFHTVLSLFVTNSVLALIQAFGVTILAIRFLPEISFAHSASIYKAIFLVTTTSVAMGLLISSVGKSARSALSLVPVFLIPQILLGGLFRPLSNDAPVYTFLANLNPQRWAFNIALTNSTYSDRGVMQPEVGVLQNGPSFGLYSTLKELIVFSEGGIKQIYFPINNEILSVTPTSALISICLFCLFGAYLCTRQSCRS